VNTKIAKYFSSDYLQQKAKDTGFFKRKSKLTSLHFFDVMMFGASTNTPFSLRESCVEASNRHNISVTKQGIDSRFNDGAQSFMKGVFEDIFHDQISSTYNLDFLKHFSSVNIKDGTKFQLHKSLKELFPGAGGSGTGAGVCIQTEFDLKSGVMTEFDITPEKQSDFKTANKWAEKAKKRALYIADLGYFNVSSFQKIIKAEASFLSLLVGSIKVFTLEMELICFDKIYKEMKRNKITSKEMDVLVGVEAKLPVRLIIELVPDNIYTERILKKTNKRNNKKKQISQEAKSRAHFNLMVTNVEKEHLSAENSYKLYRIRWQIELVFKTWKSTYSIDKVRQMNVNRFRCYLYAKLIWILVNTQIVNLTQAMLHEGSRIRLSSIKCHRTLMLHLRKLHDALRSFSTKGNSMIKNTIKILSRNHEYEPRKDRVNASDIYILFT